jgi:hypothetical protein
LQKLSRMRASMSNSQLTILWYCSTKLISRFYLNIAINVIEYNKITGIVLISATKEHESWRDVRNHYTSSDIGNQVFEEREHRFRCNLNIANHCRVLPLTSLAATSIDPSLKVAWWTPTAPRVTSSCILCTMQTLKALPVLNKALRHEGGWGSGCIDPRFLDLITNGR